MQHTMTDAELVAGHLAGDRSALAAIYDRYADSLYDTAAAMTRQRHDAADVVQDVFVAAAERMGQLRDPAKLKPWLFAILRNEVYRRTGKQRRTVATDFTSAAAEMTAPTESADDGTAVEYEELAELVRHAAAGLDERDQLVLELSVRQGLQGDDLADALGVSAQQCYGLVHRMRQRTERSLGAYCVARTGRKECTELAEILRGWDGEFSVLIRKRVARHVDGCDVCERSRRTLAPFALFGAAPVFAAPSDLRDRVLAAVGGPTTPPAYGFEAPGGFPSAIRSARRIGLWIVAATVVLLVGTGAAVFVLADDDASIAIVDGTTTSAATTTAAVPTTTLVVAPPVETTSASTDASASASTIAPASTVVGTTFPVATTTTLASAPAVPATTVPSAPATTAPPTTAPATTAPPTTPPTTAPAPGSLTLSAGSLHFDRSTDRRTLTLTNSGGQAVAWSATAGPLGFAQAQSPFSFAPTSGNLAAGASVQVTFEIDRGWPTEGPVPGRRVTFTAPGTSAAVDLTGEIGRPPVITPVEVPPPSSCIWFFGNGVSWQVAISDESPPISATVELVAPSGVVQTATMSEDGNWYGFLMGSLGQNGVIEAGTHRWTIRATDAFGNVGSLTRTMVLSPETIDC